MRKANEVGYGRPPKEGQFVKGRSGNPKGRPKGSKSYKTMFNQIVGEPITITENGRAKTMPRKQAVLLQIITRSLNGDQRMMRYYLQLLQLCEESEQISETSAEPDERETAVLQNILKRMMRINDRYESGNKAEPKAESTEEDNDQ